MADSTLTVDILGVGVLGPGLDGWPQTRAILRGEAPYTPAATVIPPPQRLPATERRRAGAIIKVSIVAADEALATARLDPTTIATVFSASEGDGRNCHELCEALATSERMVSPTRFTNSVHNAPAGYWHIATQSMAPSTSLCAYDDSFAMGLLEAAIQATTSAAPVLLVVADAPYPQPLQAKRPLPDAMAVALVVAPVGSSAATTHITIESRGASRGMSRGLREQAPTVPAQPVLADLARAIPAARGLVLLEALAGEATSVVDVETLRVRVRPSATA